MVPEEGPTVVPSKIELLCSVCRARYSIGEELVRGQVHRIRCDACGNVIEVWGGDSTRVPALGRGSSIWFLVIQ